MFLVIVDGLTRARDETMPEPALAPPLLPLLQRVTSIVNTKAYSKMRLKDAACVADILYKIYKCSATFLFLKTTSKRSQLTTFTAF